MNDKEKLDLILKAVKELERNFNNIQWVWDGDCGADFIVDRFVDEVEAIYNSESTPIPRKS